MLILKAKYVSFTKASLLIIVSAVIIDDWNAINNGMLVGKKCCIGIIKGTNNLRQEKIEKRTHIVRHREYNSTTLQSIDNWCCTK